MAVYFSLASEAALQAWAPELVQLLVRRRAVSGATVLALRGDLGAGKTTLVKALAVRLGISETVTSPTFTIMKRYETGEGASFATLYHLDVYRIEDLSELTPLHFNELLRLDNTLICIEWAEKIASLLPPHTIVVTLEHAENGRLLSIA